MLKTAKAIWTNAIFVIKKALTVHVDTNSSFKCTDGKSKLQVERFSHG